MSLPDITIIALGGTIAAVHAADGRPAQMALDAQGLLDAVPEVGEVARIKAETFRRSGSAELSFSDIVELAARIRSEAASGAHGVVVTQGTDTLEETAFLLDRLLSVDIPVIMTGAMRHSGKPGADGPANLLSALRVAGNDIAARCGVLVVMNEEIHLARYVQKTHAIAVSAFSSLPLGPIGYVAEDRVRIPLVPVGMHRCFDLAPGGAVPKVALVPLALDASQDILRHIAHSGHDGAVIQTFGAGHCNARDLDALHAVATSMPTMFCTGTAAGETHVNSCDFSGSELRLIERGLIPAYGLSGKKTRLLLTLLLADGASLEDIRNEFDLSSS